MGLGGDREQGLLEWGAGGAPRELLGPLMAEWAEVRQAPPGLPDPPHLKKSRASFALGLVRLSEVRPCVAGPVGLEQEESRTAPAPGPDSPNPAGDT